MKFVTQRLFALIAVAAALGLAGCNTMHGIGQDI